MVVSEDTRIKSILKSHKVPLPPDFDERLTLLIQGLRRDPKFKDNLEKFKKQKGGADPTVATPVDTPSLPSMDSEDWLGPNIITFLDVVTSPAARGLLKSLFMVIFFISYLESIPVFGSILASALDIIIAGNKSITKSIQKNLPPVVGLLPIPYASMVGLLLAAMYGAFVWPMVAMIAFSRQDFAVAIESFIRAIPPPFGDTIADNFMELNRMIARINAKRVKVVNDITKALLFISNIIQQVTLRLQEGLDRVNSRLSSITTNVNAVGEKISSLSNRIVEAADVSLPRRPEAPTVPVGQGRKQLTTKRRVKHNKWTKRMKYVKH